MNPFLQAQQLNSLLDAQENQQGGGNLGNLNNLGNNVGNNLGGGGGNGGGNNMRKNFDGPPQNRNFQGGMGGGNMVSYSYFQTKSAILRYFVLLFLSESYEIEKEKYLTNVCYIYFYFVLSISIRLDFFVVDIL